MLGLKSLAIPGALSAAVVLLAYAGVLWHEKFSRASALLFALGLLIAARQAALVAALSSSEPGLSARALAVAGFSAMWLPAVLYHVVAEVLSESRHRQYSIALVWALAVVFAALAFTPLMFGRTVTYGWGTYTLYGPAGVAFAAFSVLVSSWCMRMAWNGFRRNAPDTPASARGRYLFIACCIGVVGNLDHLPRLGVGVFPFGGVWSALAALVIAWTASRYRLVEITPAFAAREFMDTMSDGVAVVDPEGVVRLVNPSLLRMLGYAPGELLHAQPPAAVAVLLYGAEGEGAWPVQACVGQEREYQDPLGQKRTLSVSISLMRDGGGQLQAVLVTIRDITAALAARERIERLAYYDPLTKLPNRVLLEERFGQAIARAERAGAMAAVLYLDLDRFKHVNDTLGHDAGDRLLQVVSERIAACVRESDLVVRNAESAHDATLARLGGDEFVLLLSPIERGEDAAKVAMRVLQSLSQPVEVGAGAPVATGVSIGIALYPDDGQNPEVLMKRAGLAMYHAKGAGRNSFRLFDAAMNTRTLRRIDAEVGLRRALVRGEFELIWETRFRAGGVAVDGLEAFIGWRHEVRGLLMPADFMPIAAEMGLAPTLFDWTLEAAFVQWSQWCRQHGAALSMTLHANIGELRHSELLADPAALFAAHRVAPSSLRLAVRPFRGADLDTTVTARIRELRSLGVGFDIDGVGDDSIHFDPLHVDIADRIRIDAGQVAGHAIDPARAIAALCGMVAGLGLEASLTGVADPAMVVAATAAGAARVQGPCFSAIMAPVEASRVFADAAAARLARA